MRYRFHGEVAEPTAKICPLPVWTTQFLKPAAGTGNRYARGCTRPRMLGHISIAIEAVRRLSSLGPIEPNRSRPVASSTLLWRLWILGVTSETRRTRLLRRGVV